MTEPQNQGQTAPQEQATPESVETPQEGVLTYTQDEFNRLMGQRAKRATEATLKELGFEKLSDAKSHVTEYRQLQEDAKSETDRERDARVAAEQERDKYRALADTRLVDSELRIALLNAGIPADRVTAASKLIEGDFDVENGKVSGVDEAVASALESMPWLMAETSTQQQTFRAADTTQVPVNNGDPQAAMGSFLNQVLNGP